jgi:uncharacterized RDD family membrane protein YckC
LEASNPYAAPSSEVRDVMPEGEVPLAGRGARLGAAILDGLMFALVVYLPIILTSGTANLLTASGDPNYAVFLEGGGSSGLVGLLLLSGVTAWLVHRNGQTIGKKLVGIKVVRSDGSRATLGRIFWLRNVPLMVVGFIPFVGQIVSLVDALLIFRASRQCLHDQIAGTIVIDA